jgi:hypothetical protein
MKRGTSMKTTISTVTLSIGIGVLGALLAAQASAGCSNIDQKGAPRSWQQERTGPGPARFISAAFLQVSDEEFDHATIVGLWKFTFTAQGNGPSGPPDGAQIDAGYVTWHGDGTELMNSGRAPTTGDFCMGVWKRVGYNTYKLNHFAMAWAFDVSAPVTGPGTGGADFVGPANIREEVTVDHDGDTYAGTFTLVQYAADEKTVLADIKGTVKASRITVDTGVGH